MPSDRLFVHALDAYGDRACLVDHGSRVWSYAEVLALGDSLAAQAGKGRRLVFIQAENEVASIAALVGCLRAGHVVHLVDAQQAVAWSPLAATYRPHALVRLADGLPGVERLHDDEIALHPSLVLLLSTSGSTGSRKLVKLSAGNVESNTRSIVQYLGLGPHDRAVTTLKLHYSYGLSVVNTHLAVGASLLLTHMAPHDAGLLPLCAASGVTHLAGVPYHFETYARLGARLETIASLRIVTQAGGRMAPDLVRAMARAGRLHGWRFFVMYGQTEAAPRISYLPPELAEAHPDAIGIAIPGGTLALGLDDGSRCTTAGVEGELLYSGPNVMIGYAESVADLETAEKIPVLHTGDLAVRDAEGLYRLTGRRARIVKPMGLRINLDELESHLQALGMEVAVVADHERVLVFHVAAADQAADPARRLAQHFNLPMAMFAARRLPALPRSANGKTDHLALAALAAADAGPRSPQALRRPGAFLQAAAREFVGILLGKGGWGSVDELFAFHFRGRTVGAEESFQSLGGDSLSYVDMSMALTELLGNLPTDWHAMSLGELRALHLGL